MTLALCGLNLAWLFLAWQVGPSAADIVRGSVLPSVPAGGITGEFVFMAIALVGTTIAPWQLFFQQSCVADKRLRFADLRLARLDTFLGAVAVVVFAGLHDAGGRRAAPAGRRLHRPRADGRGAGAVDRPARADAHPADDGQRRPARRHRDLALLGLGLRRGDGLAHHPAVADQRGAGVLRDLRRLRRARRRAGADPAAHRCRASSSACRCCRA